MNGEYLPKVVLDTNVVFEGLTKQGSACSLIIDVWFAQLINVCVSDALVYEYIDVLERKFSPQKWQQVQIVLATLLHQSTFTSIFYTWRPTSPDPGDDLVIDCAMNANAIVVTANVKDFRLAHQELGLQVMRPVEFVNWLAHF